MSALDNYTLRDKWQAPLAGIGGTVSIVNLNIGVSVSVHVHHAKYGSEDVLLSQAGATLVLPLDGIDELEVTATSYPATILYVNTAVPMTLSTPQSFAGSAGGGTTVNVGIVGYSGFVRTGVVTVGVTPTPLPAIMLPNRRNLSVQAPATNTATIYLGGGAVTADQAATGGLQLPAGATFGDSLGGAVLYGIVAAGTQPIIVYEVS